MNFYIMNGKSDFIKFNNQYDEIEEEFFRKIEAEINSLSKGQLPVNWCWIDSSENTVVAKRSQDKYIDSVYFKKFLKRSFLENFKSLLRGSRCERSIRQAALLLDKGFNTPEVVCWGRYNANEFMITRDVSSIGYGDSINKILKIDHCDSKNINDIELVNRKRNLVSGIGHLVGELHKAGIIHGDLRPNNVLIKSDGSNNEFYLIDNERNKIFKKPPEKLIIKNLVQIMMFFPEDLSKAYRCRFYKKYFSVVEQKDIKEQKRIMKSVHDIVSTRLEGRVRNNADL